VPSNAPGNGMGDERCVKHGNDLQQMNQTNSSSSRGDLTSAKIMR
jgi:hypothetical protein